MGLWQRIYHPKPAPPDFAQGRTLPEASASWYKVISLGWITPLLFVGFSRPLQKDDLWELDDSRRVTNAVERVMVDFEQRGSLPGALHAEFWQRFWLAGALKLASDALAVTSPLVTNALLTFLTEAYVHARAPDVIPAPRIGRGIGLAFGLALMQLVAAVCENHYQQRVMGVGMLVRSTVSALIFRKSLRLSARARIKHSKGQITTMISEDSPRMETAAYTIHHLWIAPIQLIVGIALLIHTLKVSALVGLGVVLFSFPVQAVILLLMFTALRQNVQTVDARVKLLQEVLGGVRSVKMHAWETYFTSAIGALREKELTTIRRFSLLLSALIAATALTPIGSSTLSFITYSLTKHTLEPATIFSALQLFGIIRLPLLLLPIASSSAVEAQLALGRIGKFLAAEEAPPSYELEQDEDDKGDDNVAVEVKASFTWEREEPPAPKPDSEKTPEEKAADAKEKQRLAKAQKAKDREAKKRERERQKKIKAGVPVDEEASAVDVEPEKTADEKTDDGKEPFALHDIDLRIPRGALVALVGRVGSGKSSFLEALAGDMRKTEGTVRLRGDLAYAPQSPWIVNASVRDNILFGAPVDEERYTAVLRACALAPDLAALASGDATEIGERGITLSGGQKARVALGRAAYASAQTVLLDDPLSAVDAHVGAALVEHCLLDPTGPMAGRTRVLVTHQLSVLPRVDRVIVFDGGRIAEQGTYDELIAHGGALARLVDEYGTGGHHTPVAAAQEGAAPDTLKAAVESLMQDEDRVLGQVQWRTYSEYFRAAGGVAWMPWLLFCLAVSQVLQVADNLFLGWWTGRQIHGFNDGEYIAVYASLGAGEGLLAFITAFSFSLAAIRASRQLFQAALERVMHSPVSFFDTTPMGRIVSRLTKDVNTLDQGLAFIFFTLFNGSFGVFGTIGLVFYNFPYLGILFAPLGVLYTVFFLFYRRNSVEVKRLDSVLRSVLYSSYIEALAGLSTIRATRQEDQFVHRTEKAIDDQNRAAYLTISVARWLNLRLNLFSSTLILGIGLFAVGERTHINPANVGVVLTYSLTIMNMMADLVSQFATMEQNLNSVERMIAFSELPREGSEGGKEAPPAKWPAQGEIKFSNVVMSYREGLPDVLRDVSFEIRAGEKVGVVGRTGAGKSSLVQVLLRMFELKSGKIEIDGIDIRTLDLESLRSHLSVIPQDSVFLGTLRDTIDPLRLRTDAELLQILQQAHLLPSPGTTDSSAETSRFTLDSSVGAEGVSLSAGEKQQLALCRVLVKRSKVVILDEATSSVDVETDAKLQRTILSDLSGSTLLCIAHRLNTIAAFDRVLVMENGHVAEFDTPLRLYDEPNSAFRSLCDQAKLTRDDIIRLRKDAFS